MLKMHMKALTAKVKMTAANATPIFTAIGRFWIFFMVVFVWKAAAGFGRQPPSEWDRVRAEPARTRFLYA
ncbi:hypothetical protein [Caballeronia arvi]|uniref:hypothetical protein n=1 Tax=Caballeronia arvi TaxID=1777135 RepID=UPI00117FF764|nr:hypothetical protein [Caballeronia arvi]